MAADRLDKEAIARLEEIRGEMGSAAKNDHDKTVECAVAFFQVIAEGLNNKVMLAMLASLNIMIGESLRQVVSKAPNARARILAAQENIIDGFVRGDKEQSEQWMAKHIADLRRGYLVAKVDMDQPIL